MSYWCCKADYPDHEKSCENWTAENELYNRVSRLLDPFADKHGWMKATASVEKVCETVAKFTAAELASQAAKIEAVRGAVEECKRRQIGYRAFFQRVLAAL